MAEVARLELRRAAEVPAPAEDLWALIDDWAGMSRWWLTPDEGGLDGATLIGCELIGDPGSAPRTRRMILSDGTSTEETLLHEDSRTRRIHYMKKDDRNVIGYFATTYVDRLGDTRSRVHISSTMDVIGPIPTSMVANRFEAVYAAMLKGYARYFERRVEVLARGSRTV